MKLALPNSVCSHQDLAALTLEIHEYAKWFSHNAIKQRTHAKKASPPPELSTSAHELIRSWTGKKLLSQQMLDELIKALEDFGRTAPTLTITLAAAPPKSLKQSLVAWCRDHVTPNVLVSFQFNSTLLGGMVIRSGSHVMDWSFRRQIMEARSKFPEVLRHV